MSGRVEIFKVHLRNIKLATSAAEIAEKISHLTPGFTGADIANVCNEGPCLCVRARMRRCAQRAEMELAQTSPLLVLAPRPVRQRP